MSKHLYEEIDELHRVTERLNARIATLEAENERLRKALEWCRDRDEQNGSLPEAYAETIRAALEAKPEAKNSDKILALLDDREEAYVKHGLRDEDLP